MRMSAGKMGERRGTLLLDLCGRAGTVGSVAAAVALLSSPAAAQSQDQDRYRGEGWLERYGDQKDERVVVEEEEWYDPRDWFDDDQYDYEYEGDRGWGWRYDDERSGNDAWGFSYYGDERESWGSDDDYGFNDNDERAYDSYNGYDSGYESNGWTRMESGRVEPLRRGAYEVGYRAGYTDDEFGIDDWSSDWIPSYTTPYTNGYYDGFYDAQKGYSNDPTYYLVLTPNGEDSDRERVGDSTRRRGDRMGNEPRNDGSAGRLSGGQRNNAMRDGWSERRDAQRTGRSAGERNNGSHDWKRSWSDAPEDLIRLDGFVRDAWETRRVGDLMLFRMELFDGSTRTVAVRPGLAERLREIESKDFQILGQWERVGGREVFRVKRLRLLM